MQENIISHSKIILLGAPSLGTLQDPVTTVWDPGTPVLGSALPVDVVATGLINPSSQLPHKPQCPQKRGKMEMTPLLHGGVVALKLNSLSNAVMQEGTFMDSARDNIIKVCYDINSNISRRGAGGRGGTDETFPWGALGWIIPPKGCSEWSTQGQAKLAGFPRGTANVQGFPCLDPRDLHPLNPFSSQTSAAPLFPCPTPPLPPAFPIPIFPSFLPTFCSSSLAKPKLLPGFWSAATAQLSPCVGNPKQTACK